eukprot:TRINITY_DN11986_c0_g2_i1.p1 TRINITY_DN11986_c0_g2~~TRINITY_DN11986_c0_g2_i1.p1  ORF type:complete len:122 (-),score=28.83 TRINITY_DN11986_c0_g2_i1:83-448(-)
MTTIIQTIFILVTVMSSYQMVSSENCECSNLTIKNPKTGITTGNCLQDWCYVSSISQCSDKEMVPRSIGLYFSAMACENTKTMDNPYTTDSTVNRDIFTVTDEGEDTDTTGNDDEENTDIL